MKRYKYVHDSQKNRLYGIYQSMRQRCKNPKSKYYGGKGISICKEWNTYEAFHEWAMANGYAENLTIDRVDNNKGYSPDNCRWVDYYTQNNNTSRNIFVTYKGQTKTVGQWAREMKVNASSLHNRIRRGWPIERAMETPIKKHYKNEEKRSDEKVFNNHSSDSNVLDRLYFLR